MLEDLFKYNKLEYVHIYTLKEYNIVKPITLSHNIMNLRYFYVFTYKDRVDITLGIT